MSFCTARFRNASCRIEKVGHVSPHQSNWMVTDSGQRYRYEWWEPEGTNSPDPKKNTGEFER